MSITKNTNRLIHEKSPYLLQHAHNPVDWYPWGNEAFEKAKREDKPVFLSIGYSTCHWCHVMAHESFEDDEAADILNKYFVSVKVDREERPDVDAVYMSVSQAMTGSGGWPLTIIMTPEQKPFFAGTYLPKNSKYGRIGLIELLEEIYILWVNDRKKIDTASRDISSALQREKTASQINVNNLRELVKKGYNQLERNFDARWGGFGVAPKFPTPHNLLFLMQYSKAEKELKALKMVEKTLEQMYRGGIFDHIGGGFSRYSTDEKWLVPHFEKMLYDNALLAYAYIEAYTLSRRPFYKEVVEKTLEYVLRELTNSQGAFLCGQDADSEGVEGKYYVFRPEEVKAQLGNEDGEYFCKYYGIDKAGNFELASIPNLIKNTDYEKSDVRIRKLALKMLDYRARRTVLHKDDKVLTSWNALMIAAMAKAALITDNPKYFESAKKAERFISENLVDSSGRLMVRWREGEAAIQGHIDDYAFYVFSLLEMYKYSFDTVYLKKALNYAKRLTNLFFDNEDGGFYFTASDAEKLIMRPKELYDGAIPSGNSVAALSLIRLARLCGDTEIQSFADKQLKYIASGIEDYPAAYCFSLLSLLSEDYPSAELICVDGGKETPFDLLKFIKDFPKFNLSIVLKNEESKESLKDVAPFSESYKIPDAGSLYYLCKGQACSPPESSIEKVIPQLQEII